MVEAIKKIQIPLYGGWIIVVISDEDNVYEAARRHFKTDDTSLQSSDAVVLGKEDNSPRIYPALFSKHITPGMVAHEAIHIVNKIFADVGIQLDRYNDESEAYLLMWIVNRITEVNTKYEKLLNS